MQNLPNVRGNDQSSALRNFLSVYALTQNTSANGSVEAGTWSLLPVKNGAGVREALFGSGVQGDKQLIQNVWIGDKAFTDSNGVFHPLNDNPYTGINAVLDKLGFVSTNGLHHGQQNGHHNHFHIDLRAPVRKGLPENLLTEKALSEQSVSVVNEQILAHAQSLIDQVKMELNLTQGEVVMLISDMPNVPPQEVPVMIAQANQAQQDDMMTTRTMGVCQIIPNGAGAVPSLDNTISPIVSAGSYLYQFEKYTYEQQNIATSTAAITILQQPKHGTLRLATEADHLGTGIFDPASELYAYLPETGYFGNDSVTLLVDVGGIKVKVMYFFQMIDVLSIGAGLDKALCGEKGTSWKISSTLDANGNSTINSVEYQSPAINASASVTDTATLVTTLEANLLSDFLLDASNVTVTFADLPGAAVGQTVGNTITLDNNAAGHNWFIDTTPADNSAVGWVEQRDNQ